MFSSSYFKYDYPKLFFRENVQKNPLIVAIFRLGERQRVGITRLPEVQNQGIRNPTRPSPSVGALLYERSFVPLAQPCVSSACLACCSRAFGFFGAAEDVARVHRKTELQSQGKGRGEVLQRLRKDTGGRPKKRVTLVEAKGLARNRARMASLLLAGPAC